MVCSPPTPSQHIFLMLQLVFSLSRRFWVLMPSGQQRTLVSRLNVLFAVTPHDLRLKGLSQLNLSHSKSATHKNSQNTPMVTRSTVRDGSLNEITPCPMLHGKTPVHYQGMITTPASCTIGFIRRAFQCPTSAATTQRGPGFYVAEIRDPANSQMILTLGCPQIDSL